MTIRSAFAALVLLLSCTGSSLAQSITFAPSSALGTPGAGNATVPASLALIWDAGSSTADAMEFTVTFDASKLTLLATGVDGTVCSVAPGLLTVIRFDAGGMTIPSGSLCNLNFTTTVAAVDGDVLGLTPQDPVLADGGSALPPPILNPGSISIEAAPIGVITITGSYVPNAAAAGNVGATVTVGVIDFTLVNPGQNAGAASVVCTDSDVGTPPALTPTPASQTGLTTAVEDVSVGCTLTNAAQAGTVDCSINGGAPTPFAITCPAGTTTNAGPVPPRLQTIPASSPGLLLGLIVLMAAFGAAMVGVRRQP